MLAMLSDVVVPNCVWLAVLPLAIPIALQNLLMTSFRLVDTLMVGRLGDVSSEAVVGFEHHAQLTEPAQQGRSARTAERTDPPLLGGRDGRLETSAAVK